MYVFTQVTTPAPEVNFMCEFMGRATQDVPVYNCDYSPHYDLLTPPDSSLALEGHMSLRLSFLANIVMEEWCNTAEQQLVESADLYSYHPVSPQLEQVMAVHCTVLQLY